MSNKHLDRAINAGERAYCDLVGFSYSPIKPDDEDRTYARALVAELLRGMEKDPYEKDASGAKTYSCIGFNAALAEIKRRSGLEGEG